MISQIFDGHLQSVTDFLEDNEDVCSGLTEDRAM